MVDTTKTTTLGTPRCGLFHLGIMLLITGGVMLGVCHDAGTNGTCGGNTNIAATGKALLIAGGVLEGVACCCLSIATTCVALNSPV